MIKKSLLFCVAFLATIAAGVLVLASEGGQISSGRRIGIITIQYDANGGIGEPGYKRIYQDSRGIAWFTLSESQPQREGYQFLGWRLLNSVADSVNEPGEQIGINTGRTERDQTFIYLASWKCEQTNASNPNSLDVADMLRAGMSYREIQNTLSTEVIRLVNEIRAEYGLPALVENRRLTQVAQNRAQESTDYGYITGHVSHLTGLAHTEHARAVGLDVEFAGENWGGRHRTPEIIVQAWMESPGHRDFLLAGHESSQFGHNPYVGVGVAWCSNGGFVSDKNWILWQMR